MSNTVDEDQEIDEIEDLIEEEEEIDAQADGLDEPEPEQEAEGEKDPASEGGEGKETQASEGEGDDESESLVVTFGDEVPPAEGDDEFKGKAAPQWVRDLRKKAKELERENRELKRKREDETKAKESPKLRQKPKLEDFYGDDDPGASLVADLDKWYVEKTAHDASVAEQEKQRAKQEEEDEAIRNKYRTARESFMKRAPDYEEAESDVLDALGTDRFGILAGYFDNSEAMIYGLARNEAQLKQLSSVTDHIKFIIAVRDLQGGMKVTQKKPTTKPERKLTGGTSPTSAGSDVELMKLEAQADRTGDRSKIIAYLRAKREMANRG